LDTAVGAGAMWMFDDAVCIGERFLHSSNN